MVRRTASEILELRGAYKTNPERKRPPAPKPDPEVGKPPESLSESARLCWQEIVDICAPGVLTKSDRIMVEVAAVLLDEFRQADEPFMTSRISRLESMLARLGLSPTDRQRVAIPQKPEPNEFADL